MNMHLLTKDQELSQPLINFLRSTEAKLLVENQMTCLFRNAVDYPGQAFFIQSNCEPLSTTLDFIKDLRNFFGSFPLIFTFAESRLNVNPTFFLNAGVDDNLSTPFDFALLENFLSENLQRESFLPIKYRTVPSGGSSVTLNRKVCLQEISSSGITFKTSDFIPRGSIFSMNLSSFLPVVPSPIPLKLISSEVDEDSDLFIFFAEFFEMNEQLKKEIRFFLKNNQ